MKDIDKETQIPVLLSICSEQLFEGQEPDHIELITEGTLELLPDGLRFFYQETELTGMEGTTTSFQLCGPQVILSRTGAVNSRMVFEEGRQHTSLYETPFGELAVDVQTSRLRHNLTERGGLLDLRYSIAIEHAAMGRNAFKIRIQPRRS